MPGARSRCRTASRRSGLRGTTHGPDPSRSEPRPVPKRCGQALTLVRAVRHGRVAGVRRCVAGCTARPRMRSRVISKGSIRLDRDRGRELAARTSGRFGSRIARRLDFPRHRPVPSRGPLAGHPDKRVAGQPAGACACPRSRRDEMSSLLWNAREVELDLLQREYRSTGEAGDAAFAAELVRSFPHPWILRGIRKHARAATLGRIGTQLEVPRLVAVDLAEPVPRATLCQPRRGIA